MLFTFQEAVEECGSRQKLRDAVSKGLLSSVARGLYSTDPDADMLSVVSKLYPEAIITGATALYLHRLIDTPPDRIDIASKRGGTKIRDFRVKQHFIPEEWLDEGAEEGEFNGVKVRIYSLERMLLELMRNRNKLPYDIYKEAISSFRKKANSMNIYRLQDYSEAMPRGESYLDRALAEVF